MSVELTTTENITDTKKDGVFVIRRDDVEPVFYLRSMEFFIRVTPIKRKLNRYSKKYIKKIAIKVTDHGKAKVINRSRET